MALIYLAARYGRREEIAEYAALLTDDGHTITGHWWDGSYEHLSTRAWAEEDLAAIERTEVFLAFTEPPGEQPGRNRGGRHVEFGYALACGMTMVLVGPREHVFAHLGFVAQFDTFEQLRTALRGRGFEAGAS